MENPLGVLMSFGWGEPTLRRAQCGYAILPSGTCTLAALVAHTLTF